MLVLPPEICRVLIKIQGYPISIGAWVRQWSIWGLLSHKQKLSRCFRKGRSRQLGPRKTSCAQSSPKSKSNMKWSWLRMTWLIANSSLGQLARGTISRDKSHIHYLSRLSTSRITSISRMVGLLAVWWSFQRREESRNSRRQQLARQVGLVSLETSTKYQHGRRVRPKMP